MKPKSSSSSIASLFNKSKQYALSISLPMVIILRHALIKWRFNCWTGIILLLKLTYLDGRKKFSTARVSGFFTRFCWHLSALLLKRLLNRRVLNMGCRTCFSTSSVSLSNRSSWFESPLLRNTAGFDGQFGCNAKWNKSQWLNKIYPYS